MTSPAEDIIASIISEDDAKKMKRQLALKAELKPIDKSLKPLFNELKREMDAAEIKSIEAHGMKVTYTSPREYEDFVDKNMVIRFLKERGRNDLIQPKKGYSRLRITQIKEKDK